MGSIPPLPPWHPNWEAWERARWRSIEKGRRIIAVSAMLSAALALLVMLAWLMRHP